MGSTFAYDLPQITDPDGDEYVIDVSLGNALGCVVYQSKIITVYGLNSCIGTKTLTIKLTDDNIVPEISIYTF